MLLPTSHQPMYQASRVLTVDSTSEDTAAESQQSQLKPSHMLGPACALRVLSDDETIRKATNSMEQFESLKDLWLDGNLVEKETAPWRVKTPTRDDVLEMIDKIIKSVNGDFSTDLGVTSNGHLALPDIQHWDRLAVLVKDSVAKVIVPAVVDSAMAGRCVGYFIPSCPCAHSGGARYVIGLLSHRQMAYLLARLQRALSPHAGTTID
ncbi:hypothetical protein BS17DRAFT_442812 [Gyrodon lividus]|nr:hypothetical protein BS17DRAFT_442812 [Gyrodon lividus]